MKKYIVPTMKMVFVETTSVIALSDTNTGVKTNMNNTDTAGEGTRGDGSSYRSGGIWD